MALSRTTLSAAVALNDVTVLLASITSLVSGDYLLIDQELMQAIGTIPAAATSPVSVLRGLNTSAQVAHAISAGVVRGAGSDFAGPIAAAANLGAHPPVRGRVTRSYGATGALDLPTPGSDATAILNGTTICAMTLANPGVDNEGDKLLIGGNGKAAHTVTYTAGLGNVGASADVITFSASQQQAFELVAIGGFWCGLGTVAGAATVAGVGIG